MGRDWYVACSQGATLTQRDGGLMTATNSGFQASRRTPAGPASELRGALRRLVPSAWSERDLAVRLAGEIHVAGGLCDIVALLAQSGRSGTLVVASSETIRAVVFETGELVGAATTAAHERIGDMLYRSGEVARDDIEEATMLAALDGRRIGEVLVALGRVEIETLEQLLARQAEEIFYAALRVEDGVFCFVEERLDVALIAPERPSLQSLLMEGARRMDEMLVFRQRVGSSRHIPQRLNAVALEGHGATIDDHLLTLLDLCDGVRCIADIGREVGLLEFEVTQAFYQLGTQGHVEFMGPRANSTADIITTYNEVLVEVHRLCDRVRRGDDVRRALERYVSRSAELSALLEDVLPHDDGSVDVGRILRNLGAGRRDSLVKRALGGYADFAVFHAGSLLPPALAAELPGIVTRLLEPLTLAPTSSRSSASLAAATG